MTLDEAIEHACDKALEMCKDPDTCKCGQEHLQLVKWLEELKAYRAKYLEFTPRQNEYFI